MLLRNDGLVVERGDALVDLDAVGPGPHEGRLLLVPDVADVEDGVAGRPEVRQKPRCRRRRGLGPLERVGAAREVVLLDVDDDEAARHGESKPGQTNRARNRPIPQ